MATNAISSEVSQRPASWPATLLTIGRVALGAIFLIAAYAKLHFAGEWHLRDYQFFFAMAIDSYKMLPISAVQLMAQILPWFELVLGIFLIAGIGVFAIVAIVTPILGKNWPEHIGSFSSNDLDGGNAVVLELIPGSRSAQSVQSVQSVQSDREVYVEEI